MKLAALLMVFGFLSDVYAAEESFLACESKYEIVGDEIVTIAGPGVLKEIVADAEGNIQVTGIASGTKRGPGYFAIFDGSKVTVKITTDALQQASINAFVSTEVDATLSFGLNPVSEESTEITTMIVTCGLKSAGQ